MPTEDVYILYSLKLKAESRPGDIESVLVRARNEGAARKAAAPFAGREGREVWSDPERTPCLNYGHAYIQWHGVVHVLAHRHREERETMDVRVPSSHD